MAYTEFGDYNTSEGITSLFTYSVETVPVFVPLLLFAIFIISVVGSFFAQKRIVGRGDLPGSFAVGSWLTAILAIVLSLIPDFIRTGTLVFTIALAILGTIWLYVSRMDQGI